VVADDRRLIEIDRSLAGQPSLEPEGDDARFMAALAILAREDPTVGFMLGRIMHMLVTPDEAAADPVVAAAVARTLESGRSLLIQAPGPTREQFEALLA
jgi:hypothetical protein